LRCNPIITHARYSTPTSCACANTIGPTTETRFARPTLPLRQRGPSLRSLSLVHGRKPEPRSRFRSLRLRPLRAELRFTPACLNSPPLPRPALLRLRRVHPVAYGTGSTRSADALLVLSVNLFGKYFILSPRTKVVGNSWGRRHRRSRLRCTWWRLRWGRG
jgi:hypothetical protein